MTEQATLDWQRVARFVRERRLRLALNQEDSRTSPSTWTKIENAKQNGYKPFTLGRIEADLQWPAGTIMNLAHGGNPPEVDTSGEDRIRALEAQVAELTRLVRRMGTVRGDRG